MICFRLFMPRRVPVATFVTQRRELNLMFRKAGTMVPPPPHPAPVQYAGTVDLDEKDSLGPVVTRRVPQWVSTAQRFNPCRPRRNPPPSQPVPVPPQRYKERFASQIANIAPRHHDPPPPPNTLLLLLYLPPTHTPGTRLTATSASSRAA